MRLSSWLLAFGVGYGVIAVAEPHDFGWVAAAFAQLALGITMRRNGE